MREVEGTAASASASPEDRGLPLRRLLLRTHLPAVVGIALSLVVLAAVAALMTLSVEPRLSQLRSAGSAARDAHDAMLDEETGVRGYLATGGQEFLQPYLVGKRRRTDADAEAITALAGEPVLLNRVVAVVKAQEAWQDRWATPAVGGEWAVARVPGDEAGPAELAAQLRDGKVLFDAYRKIDAELQSSIAGEITATEGAYRTALVASVLVLALIGLASLVALVRGTRRVHRQLVAPVLDLTDVVERVRGGRPEPASGRRIDRRRGGRTVGGRRLDDRCPG